MSEHDANHPSSSETEVSECDQPSQAFFVFPAAVWLAFEGGRNLTSTTVNGSPIQASLTRGRCEPDNRRVYRKRAH